SPTPVVPSPAPDLQVYWLRLMVTQALAPQYVFAMAPLLVITGDGMAVSPGAVPSPYPGPLVAPLVGAQVTEAGRAKIMAWAAELGLLSGKTDFSGAGGMMPGGQIGRMELTVDGKKLILTGPLGITADNPSPGSAEAFGVMWDRLTSLSTSLPGETGPQSPYTPVAYSVLVGPSPAPDPNLPQAPVDWPLDVALATFGGPVAGGTLRCGTVDGADALTLGKALAAANALSAWVQDPTTSATFGLTVRPLTPGEDACAETFGG
ncbi:MAG: hypothetical protein WCK58_16325, partial [Chloroflexota bacterium]